MLAEFADAVFKRIGAARPPVYPQQVQQVPQVLTVPIPMPMGVAGRPLEKKKPEDLAKVIIKQTVKQEVGTRKARRRKADTKGLLRKQYNKLKKASSKEFRKRRSEEYQKMIKELSGTKSEKVARRKTIKATLQKRLKLVLAKMPSATKKDAAQLDKMIREIKKLKW